MLRLLRRQRSDHGAVMCWTGAVPALLALLSSLIWGVADFAGGLASRRSTALQTLMVTTPAGLVLILPIGILMGGNVSGTAIPGIGAGVFGAVGILLLYAAFAAGPMGIVSPLSAVLGAALPVLVGLIRGDRPGLPAYLGMALAVVAIVTVGLEPHAPTDDRDHQQMNRRAFLLSLGAGMCIGMFFTLISFGPTDGGLWPVVWSRLTSTIVVIALALVMWALSRSKSPGSGPPRFVPALNSVRGLAVLAGILDVAANAFYVLAAQVGLLSVVAILGSLYPAATVLLARFLLAERLRPIQKLGMVTALVAAVLLAI